MPLPSKSAVALKQALAFRVEWLLIIPIVAYIFIPLDWEKKKRYEITGDEPHYLVIARSIWKDFDLDLTNNFKDEMEHGYILRGLKPQPQEILPDGRTFSHHNLGVPLLILVPYALFGTAGARVFMAILASALPLIFYRVLLEETGKPKMAVFGALALCLALPFLPAANQIFPDLPTGVLALLCVEACRKGWGKPQKGPARALALGLALAFLPWLHFKNCLAALVILGFAFLGEGKKGAADLLKRPIYLLAAPVMLAASIGLYPLYHYHYTGSILGHYGKGSLVLEFWPFVMGFLGHHLDQVSGIFMMDPLFFLALVGIVPMARKNLTFFLFAFMVYMSLLGVNSLHHVKFGGFCFPGRYGWSSYPLLIYPVSFALGSIKDRHEKAIYALFAMALLFQLLLVPGWYRDQFLLKAEALSPDYARATFYPIITSYMPNFTFNPAFLHHPPNYAFFIFSIVLITFGINGLNRARWINRVRAAIMLCCFIMLFFATPDKGPLGYHAADLPSNVGELKGTARYAQSGRHVKGHLIYGPYRFLEPGDYMLKIEYSSLGENSEPAGKWDVIVGKKRTEKKALPDIGGELSTITDTFTVEGHVWPSYVETRVLFTGYGYLEVTRLEITRL